MIILNNYFLKYIISINIKKKPLSTCRARAKKLVFIKLVVHICDAGLNKFSKLLPLINYCEINPLFE